MERFYDMLYPGPLKENEYVCLFIAETDEMGNIEAIANQAADSGNAAMKTGAQNTRIQAPGMKNSGIRDVRIKGVRDTRKKERQQAHMDYVEEYCHA